MQVCFFEEHGELLARQIVAATACWSTDKKEYLRFVIPLVIIDKALEEYPEVDEAQIESAKSNPMPIPREIPAGTGPLTQQTWPGVPGFHHYYQKLPPSMNDSISHQHAQSLFFFFFTESAVSLTFWLLAGCSGTFDIVDLLLAFSSILSNFLSIFCSSLKIWSLILRPI